MTRTTDAREAPAGMRWVRSDAMDGGLVLEPVRAVSCEGCGKPATKTSDDGIELCGECYNAIPLTPADTQTAPRMTPESVAQTPDESKRFDDFVKAVAQAICLDEEDTQDALNWPYENLLPQIATLYNKSISVSGDSVSVPRSELEFQRDYAIESAEKADANERYIEATRFRQIAAFIDEQLSSSLPSAEAKR